MESSSDLNVRDLENVLYLEKRLDFMKQCTKKQSTLDHFFFILIFNSIKENDFINYLQNKY